MNVRVVVSEDVDHAVGDITVEKWFEDVLKSTEQGENVYVGTGVMLDRLRLAHKEGDLFIEAVIFKEEIIFVAEDSQLECWPRGMFDQHENIVSKILGWI